jgi:hypothetical protein
MSLNLSQVGYEKKTLVSRILIPEPMTNLRVIPGLNLGNTSGRNSSLERCNHWIKRHLDVKNFYQMKKLI